MKRLIIITDENSEFLVSKADLKNYTSMDVRKIKENFESYNFEVEVIKFSQLDLSKDYSGVNVLYQSSEEKGSFYKRFVENIVFYLEKQGARTLPRFEYLKAHHDKTFMELLRIGFTDNSLKTLNSNCYGSFIDAKAYNFSFPIVIKESAGSGGEGVFLARSKKEYDKLIKKAGRIILGQGWKNLLIDQIKILGKKIIKYFYPKKSVYSWSYGTNPLSTPLVIQSYIEGLRGDYKVLIFGKKFFFMFRKNRKNDFRASGSGKFYDVPQNEHIGLLNYANKITNEIDFPIIGMDIGYDGLLYHLIEFQMIDLGPVALQRSEYWYEFQDNQWKQYFGTSNLEDDFSTAIMEYINSNFPGK